MIVGKRVLPTDEDGAAKTRKRIESPFGASKSRSHLKRVEGVYSHFGTREPVPFVGRTSHCQRLRVRKWGIPTTPASIRP